MSNYVTVDLIVGHESRIRYTQGRDIRYEWSVYLTGKDTQCMSSWVNEVHFQIPGDKIKLKVIKNEPYAIFQAGYPPSYVGIDIYYYNGNKREKLSHKYIFIQKKELILYNSYEINQKFMNPSNELRCQLSAYQLSNAMKHPLLDYDSPFAIFERRLDISEVPNTEGWTILWRTLFDALIIFLIILIMFFFFLFLCLHAF